MLQDTTSSTKGYNTGIKTDNMGPTKDGYLVLPEFLLEPEQDQFETPPIYYPNDGVNQDVYNRFNWKRAIAGALAGLLTGGIAGAVVGGVIGGFLSDSGGGGGGGNRFIDVLPPGELESVTSWVKNNFTPYLNTIIADLNGILENFNVTKLQQLNDVSRKLCILQNFYQNVNNDTFLSQEGIDFRYSLIEPYFGALQNLIKEKAATINAGGVATTVNNNSAEISILPNLRTGSATCMVYTVGKGNISTASGGVKTSPTPTTTQTATSTNPTISNSIVKKPLVLLGIGALVTALLWPNKKKSKN